MNRAQVTTAGRSAAMAPPGSDVTISRELLLELIDDYNRLASLVERFGADLKTIAKRSGPPS